MTSRMEWRPALGRCVEVDEEALVAETTRPIAQQQAERRVKHILFHDKQTGQVIAHMEASEDSIDLAAIKAHHGKPGEPLAAIVLETREFRLPKGDKIPDDLFVTDISTRDGKIKGKHRTEPD